MFWYNEQVYTNFVRPLMSEWKTYSFFSDKGLIKYTDVLTKLSLKLNQKVKTRVQLKYVVILTNKL